ncbi:MULTISPECIES: asparaginase [unclassified Luteococcus]|uniref:asparaginase n=1 Tax=unclassified Luteococcus TaxID=2639923 RepID=UPI00313B7BE7
MNNAQPSPVLVQVIRHDFLECVHRGRVVLTNPDGSVALALGDAEAQLYPRSANKPMQALAMLRSGLDLTDELLALAGASHSGEGFHLDGVRRILAGVGLDESALQCTPDHPLDEQARGEWILAGHGKEPVAMNCSGKHAAMLRTCLRAGWPTQDYLAATHPLQQEVARVITELAGQASNPTVDGCGAPLFSMSLRGLAHAFGQFAGADEGELKTIADAYRNHPEWVSGTRREEVTLHRAVPGLLCKGGAEGCLAIGLADGRGIAIKADDGSARGTMAVAHALLTRLGLGSEQLDQLATAPVLGHGEPVGQVRAVPGLFDSL